MSMSTHNCPLCCKDTKFIELSILTANYLPEEKASLGVRFQRAATVKSYACTECGCVIQKLTDDSMENLKEYLKNN